MNDKENHSRLKKDVLYLLAYEPFYAYIITDLKREFSDSIPYAGVTIKDGNYVLYINAENYFSLPLDQRIFTLIHELLHLIYDHLLSSKGKDFKIWNYATDICINQKIQNKIATLPPFVITVDYFRNRGLDLPYKLSADEYYDLLIKHLDNQENKSNKNSSGQKNKRDTDNVEDGNQGGFDLSKDDAKKINHDIWKESEETGVSSEILKKKMHDLVKKSIEAAGRGDASASQFLEFEKTKEISMTPWYVIFRKIVSNKTSSASRRTWKKPHRHLGDEAMGKKKLKKSTIYVIIDTSASIKDSFLTEFYKELNSLLRFDVDIVILECDSQVQDIYKFKKSTELLFKGGGGTNFIPAFNAILHKENKLLKSPPNLVICLTDGQGLVPDSFKYKTVFCLTENGRIPFSNKESVISWGKYIYMK